MSKRFNKNQLREQLFSKWETVCSFLEFLFIIFFVIPILIPFIKLQRRINENINRKTIHKLMSKLVL